MQQGPALLGSAHRGRRKLSVLAPEDHGGALPHPATPSASAPLLILPVALLSVLGTSQDWLRSVGAFVMHGPQPSLGAPLGMQFGPDCLAHSLIHLQGPVKGTYPPLAVELWHRVGSAHTPSPLAYSCPCSGGVAVTDASFPLGQTGSCLEFPTSCISRYRPYWKPPPVARLSPAPSAAC